MQIDPGSDRAMTAAIRRPAARRPWQPLLTAVLALAGEEARLLRHAERPWASITFSGTRHSLALLFAGEAIPAGEAFIAALPEHEFAIPGQLVADAVVVSVTHDAVPAPQLAVEVELLLVEDA